MTPDELSERLLDFAVRVGKVVEAIPTSRLGRHIAGQLVRCATSPPPNYEEACAAESRDDFVHKIRIALKELRETRCWLRMIVKADLLSEIQMRKVIDESTELCNILGKSAATARGKGSRNSTAEE